MAKSKAPIRLKPETIEQLLNDCRDRLRENISRVDGLEPTITGNSKTGAIPTFNLLPFITCGNVPCRTNRCYDLKFLIRSNVREARAKNTALAMKGLTRLEASIRAYMAEKDPEFFRIHSGGDFFSQAYVDMWFRIARDYPGTRFLAFTKRVWDYSNRPANLTLVASQWPDWSNPCGDQFPKAFLQGWNDEQKRHNDPPQDAHDALRCPGLCDGCGLCWELPILDKNVLFSEH